MNRDQEIFTAALELPAPARAAFLDRECVGDPARRARVAALLAGYEAAGDSFLEENRRLPAIPAAPGGDKPGDRIGRYTLLRKIGEGGCGVVYLAEQTEPVRRSVALKVIKPGMDSQEVIARFGAERQALALMDHPGIARVFDAGTTDAGRPYFVMEFVDGEPITRFCDHHRLPTERRLELFARVCQAVQHAHQKGVIHRDLKPSNILVALQDGQALPKVIDFGIAKATQGKLTDATLATAVAQFIGTPAYMSPEQAELSGLDVDTRSDIYSLGVLLYELLTGRTPFEPSELLKIGFDEMRRHIREVEPARPSTRLNTLGAENLAATAGQRLVPPPKLVSLISGDLDWIVMRCLEKDRARRYETAAGLADDLKRHLNHEPIVARPASAGYRLRKLVRRNRLAFGAAAAVTLALCAGLATSIWQAVRAQRAERLAQSEAAITRAVNEFLMTDLLRQADSSAQAEAKTTPNPDLKVREALDRAAEKVGTRFPDQPLTEAAVRKAIGDSYVGIGLGAKAEPHLRRALELRRERLGLQDPLTWTTQLALARALFDQTKLPEAAELQSAVLTAQVPLLGENHATVDVTRNELADTFDMQGKHAEAAKLQALTYANRLRTLGPDHPDTLWSLGNLGNTYYRQGKGKEALELQARAYEGRKRVLGAAHPATLNAASSYAVSLRAQNKPAEALVLQTETLEAAERLLGPDHFQTIAALINLATGKNGAGQHEESLVLLTKGLDAAQRVLGPDHEMTLAAMNNLATTYVSLGRLAEALPVRERATAAQVRVFGPKHPNSIGATINLGVVYSRLNRIPEATETLQRARESALAELGPNHRFTLAAMDSRAALHEQLAERGEAIGLRQAVLDTRQRLFGPDDPRTISSLVSLANAYDPQQPTSSLVALRARIWDAQKRTLGAEHAQTMATLAVLGTLQLGMKEFTAAESGLRELLAFREKSAPDEWSTFNTRSSLGGALLGQRKFAEAEPLLVSGYEGMAQREAKVPPAGKVRFTEALERLVQLYRDSGQPEKMAPWQQKLEARQTVKP